MPRSLSMATVVSNSPSERPRRCKAHDRERVSFAGIREQGFQARPLHRPAGTDIAENLDGAGLGQPHGLAGDVLIASRHPRIAENGAHGVSQTTVQRRRAILVASVIDLETRLTDAALDMADKLIGGLFARPKSSRAAVCRRDENVVRLMRLFHDTIEARP